MKRAAVVSGCCVLAAGLGATSVALVPSSASPASVAAVTQVSYVLHFVGATSGTASPQPGDTLTSKSVVYNASRSKRKGRTSELCTETVAKPFTMQCSMTVKVRKVGSLTLEGAINPTNTPWTAAVVGGTGRYRGVHGTVKVTSLHGRNERWTFTLQH